MNIKQINEELRELLNILEDVDAKKLTKKDIQKVFDKLGYYYLGLENEEWTIVKITKETIPNMPELFESDLRSTGTYGYYYPVPKKAVDENNIMTWLPVYGNANHYVTKWLKPSIDKALQMHIRERGADKFSLASKNYEALGIDTSSLIDIEQAKLSVEQYKWVVKKIYNLGYWKDTKIGDKSYSAWNDNPLELDSGVYDYRVFLSSSKEYDFVVDIYVKDYFRKIKDYDNLEEYDCHITQTFGENGQFKLPDIPVEELDGDKGLDFRKTVRKAFKEEVAKHFA